MFKELMFTPHPLWAVCIFTRLSLAALIYKSQNITEIYKQIITVTLYIIGIGFAYKAYTGDNNEIQIAKVFWHKTRPIHSILFLAAATSALYDNYTLSSIFVLSDIIFSFIYRLYTNK